MPDPIIIVDARGTEHEFPPGFDPVKAAAIVRQQAAGGTETSDPTEAFWNSIKTQGKTLARGAVNTLPAVGAIVGGALSTPETMGAGTLAGGAIGAGVGRGARDLLAEFLALDPPSSPASKAARIALDVGTTAAAAKALPIVLEAAKYPKAVFGEVVNVAAHPLRTIDDFAAALRAVKQTKLPTSEFPEAIAGLSNPGGGAGARLDPEGFVPQVSGYGGAASSSASAAIPGLSMPQGTYVKLPDGSYGIQGHGLKVGDLVNVMSRKGQASVKTIASILTSERGVQTATVK